MKRRAGFLLGGLMLFAVLSVLLGCLWPLQVIFTLMFGWIGFVWRVVPQATLNPGGVAMGAACLVGVVVLGHWMARWLWREMHPASTAPGWRMRWTALSLGVVVLMFVCGIAATGVAHQAGWLIRSEEPWFTSSSWPAAIRIRCGSTMREIGGLVREYAELHDGRFPDVLADLHESSGYREFSDWTTCPSDPGLDYVYYGRGLTWPVGDDVPILAEPLANHEGEGMNVLFGDGSVRFVEADEAQAVLARRPQ